MKITWLLAQDGLDVDYISVPEKARSRLLKMGREAQSDKNSHVAIYLPLSNKRGNEPDSYRGHIIGTIKLATLDDENRMSDYSYRDKETGKYWPYGWPCQITRLESPINLKELTKEDFPRLTMPLRSGPVKLQGANRERIEKAIFHARARENKSYSI